MFCLLVPCSAATSVYANFLGASGTDSSISNGNIGGNNWNNIQFNAGTAQNLNASYLSDANGNATNYTFAATFYGGVSMNAQGGVNVSTDDSMNWYHDANGIDSSINTGNRIDNGSITGLNAGDTFATYSLGGFQTTDTVTLTFVCSRDGGYIDPNTGTTRYTGILVDGQDMGYFGAGSDIGGNTNQEFTITLTGKTEYDIDFLLPSDSGNWGPLGNAFKLDVVPIPEPSTSATMMLGLSALLLRRRVNRR